VGPVVSTIQNSDNDGAVVSTGQNSDNVVYGVPFGRNFGCCPGCGSRSIVPIIYGYPTVETVRQAQRDELHLGGCYVTGDDPQLRCRDCGMKW